MSRNTKLKMPRMLLVGLISIALLATGCGTGKSVSDSSSASSSDNKPIQIGFSSPLTGGSAQGGQDMLNGAKIAESEVNAAGGILGRQIQIVSEDDGGDPQQAVQAANKLVAGNVVGVVGYYNSGACNATLPVWNKAGMPTILAAVSATNLTHQGFKNIFRIQGNNDQQGQVAAEVMIKRLNAKKIVLVQDNTTYARGLAQSTLDWAKKTDSSVVVDVVEVTPGEKDFSTIVTKMKTLSADATYFTGYYAEGSLLLKQMRNLGIKTPFLAGDANNDPTFMSVAGADAEGVLMTSPPMVETLPAAAQFIDKYKKQFKIEPGAYAVYSYDGVMLVADAIKRANSTDKAKIIESLKNTKDFKAITSTINFDQNGDLSKPGYVAVVVKQGKFSPY